VFGQRSQLYWDLPLRESFELLRAIYRVPRAQYRENLDHFVEILDLDRFMSTPVRQLSLGERMRGDFAAALLHNPRSSTSTSRRSASTSWPRKRSAPSSPTSTSG